MFPSASAGRIPHSPIHARLDVYAWSFAAGWVALLVVSLALALRGNYHAEGNAIAGHVLLLLVGLAGIGLGRRSLRRSPSSRDAAHDALIEGEQRALRTAENAPVVEGATYLAKPFDYETLTQALRSSLALDHR